MSENNFLKDLLPAIEKQFGPVEYFTVCHSFEDSDEFKRIANIGLSTPCETIGCKNISANCCCFCTKAICTQCSHDAISEEGYEAFACANCII
jgi:hypothetical protein